MLNFKIINIQWKPGNISAPKFLAIVLFTLILTDFSIVLNLPYLRAALPFLFFTIVPGMLILQIIRPYNLEFTKKVVLWVGISISLLMFTGLALNSFYPLLEKPLSLSSVLIALNLIIIILSFVAYRYKPDQFHISNIFNFHLDLKDKLVSPLVLPFLFPFLAILGSYLMNSYENNLLLMVFLFILPIYIVILTYLKDRIHPINYPLALWLMGMGLLLMHGLTSNYILGRDVHVEYYAFQKTLVNYQWDINQFYNPYNACLSITILPTIYQVLSNINPNYVFKLFFALIGSIIPIVVYKVLEKILSQRYAFLATLLLVFQAFFINLTGCIRQEVAILFFFLAVLIFFQNNFSKSIRLKILFLILVFSMIISHYSTSYVAFVLLLPLLLIPFVKGLLKEKKINLVNFDVIISSILFTVLWFLLFAKVQLEAGSEVVGATTASVTSLSLMARESTILNMFGIGLKSLPNLIAVVVNDLIFLIIGLGLLLILWKHREFRDKWGNAFFLGTIISLALLTGFIVLPVVSFFYGPDRLFFQLLIFTAPLFIVGCVKIAHLIKKPQFKTLIILTLVLSLFVANTHLQYHFLGQPFSVEYDNKGPVRGELYLYDGEVAAAKWISSYRTDNTSVSGDAISYSRLLMGGVEKSSIKGINFNNRTINGYLYLGNSNLNEGEVYESFDLQSDIKKYSYFFNGKSRIYENGVGAIWL